MTKGNFIIFTTNDPTVIILMMVIASFVGLMMKITSLHRTYDDDNCEPLFIAVVAGLSRLFCHPRAGPSSFYMLEATPSPFLHLSSGTLQQAMIAFLTINNYLIHCPSFFF